MKYNAVYADAKCWSPTRYYESLNLNICFDITTHKQLLHNNTIQALMTFAREMYGAKLTAAFSHKPKELYRYLHHLSSYTAMPQVLIYNSTSIYYPKEKVESFNKFFNSTFTVSDCSSTPTSKANTFKAAESNYCK